MPVQTALSSYLAYKVKPNDGIPHRVQAPLPLEAGDLASENTQHRETTVPAIWDYCWLLPLPVYISYARVSTDDPHQTSSYELQKNYYEDYVSRHPHWELVGIYADEGISGTSLKHRDAFNRMIADCTAGKIEIKTAELIQFYFSGAAKF